MIKKKVKWTHMKTIIFPILYHEILLAGLKAVILKRCPGRCGPSRCGSALDRCAAPGPTQARSSASPQRPVPVPAAPAPATNAPGPKNADY